MKKLISILIVLLLIFTLSLSAFAEEATEPGNDTTEGGENGGATEPGGEGDGEGEGTEPEPKPEPKGEIVVSSKDIAKIYKPDGTEGNFNGGSGMHNVFDGDFDNGLYMNTGGSYIIIDLESSLKGGYYVTTIKVAHVGNTAYSVYYTGLDKETWIMVTDNTTAAGTISYTINEIATQVKYVFNTTIGWTQSLKEIEVKGIDPAEIDCFHRNLSDWVPVEGSSTCTGRGQDVQTCNDCGEKLYRESTTVLPTGHAYVSSIIDVGKGLITCDNCDYRLEINGEVDLMTLGGEKTEGIYQFTDVSVSSTGNVEWGVNPNNMWDGGWTTGWNDYWYPATGDDEKEYVLYEFGTEVDLTMLDIAVFNVEQTLKIYVYSDEEHDYVLAREVSAYNEYVEKETAYRMEIDLVGISTRAVKIQLVGPHQVRICEMHIYGTAKGATGVHRHNYTELVKVIIEQTCAVTGKSVYKCSCGRERETYQLATGNHSYTIYKETTLAPTCAVKGTAIYQCETCDGTSELDVDPTGDHKFTIFVSILYEEGYSNDGVKNYKCETCDGIEETPVKALVKIDGYSVKEDGTALTADYDVNVEAINLFERLTGKKVIYGIFLTGANQLSEAGKILNEDGSSASDAFVVEKITEKYESISVIISGFPTDYSFVDIEFVMGLIIEIDGEISLEQNDTKLSTVLDGAYNAVSVRHVAEITNENGCYDNTILAAPKKKENE